MSSSELSRGVQVLELDAVFVELAQQPGDAGFGGLRVEGVDELGAVLHELERQAGEPRRNGRERRSAGAA